MKRYILILVLVAILGITVFVATREEDDTTSNAESETTYSETTVLKTDIVNTVSKSSYISTGFEEKKTLHNTYYFKKIYFETNQRIKEGENIIKYTNGKYLVAPYDCIITEVSLPEEGEVCTDKHYITIQSTNTLSISLEIDEDDLDAINEGQKAQIEIEALDNKKITGYVTKINNSGTYSSSGSKFNVTVTFENNGKILLGMTAKCSIILESAEDVIAVAKEAVTTTNGKKYVNIKDSYGNITSTEITTGIENDAYVEIKSGLNEGDVVYFEKSTTNNNSNGFRNRQMQAMFKENER